MTIETDFIKSLPYFFDLSLEELEEVVRHISEKKFERGEIILYEEDIATSLYFVYSGAVKVFKTSTEGKEQILTIVRPGESFNEVPVFDDGVNPASAQAMSPAVLYELKKEDLTELMEDNCVIAQNAMRALAERIRELVLLVEDLSFRHVISRVARILLQHTGDGADAGDGPRLTQQDMAAMAGTAREVVGRSLKTLEDEGMIRLERNRIVIKDKDALNERVEATY